MRIYMANDRILGEFERGLVHIEKYRHLLDMGGFWLCDKSRIIADIFNY